MKQLSGADALYLTLEKQGNQRAHVASLAIYDPSTAPGGKVRFKGVLDFFTQRAMVSPVFRRRLVHVPLGLDRPYWIEEGEIDVEYHVRHIALPHPGDWRQLMIHVARLHARPLDLTKPAWEAYVIEGLDNIPGVPPGAFALYLKLHHSAIDGQAGALLTGAMHTTTPATPPISKAPVTLADREPTATELVARMVGNRVADARVVAGAVPGLARMALAEAEKRFTNPANKPIRKADGTSKRAPHTRFGGKLSPHRVIDAMPISFADLAAIRAAIPGATINDVFLSISAGALRRYLDTHGELPATSLNAMMPVSLRTANQGADAGNQTSMAMVPIYSHIATAGERLAQIAGRSSSSKQQASSGMTTEVLKLMQLLPAPLVEKISRQTLMSTINFTVSNVRGTEQELYLAGARLNIFIPINMLLDGLGLSITGFSYHGQMWISFIADRAMLPDPAFFAQCFRESMDEHRALGQPARKPQPARRTRRKVKAQ